MKKVDRDPLLGALIARLPPPGASWPREERVNWLRMFALACDLVYGAEAPVSVDGDTGAAPQPAAAPAPAPVKPPPLPAAFYIDHAGFACRRGGARIMPRDIAADEVLRDLRGKDGDLKSIIWADGTTGIDGLSLNIAAAAG